MATNRGKKYSDLLTRNFSEIDWYASNNFKFHFTQLLGTFFLLRNKEFSGGLCFIANGEEKNVASLMIITEHWNFAMFASFRYFHNFIPRQIVNIMPIDSIVIWFLRSNFNGNFIWTIQLSEWITINNDSLFTVDSKFLFLFSQ